MNILITAGPTIEPIDELRFISNRSSGKMGFALANASCDLGHNVCLIHGPVNLTPPDKVESVQVETTSEMIEEVLKRIDEDEIDVVISSAAIADYHPEKKVRGKIKSGKNFDIKMIKNPKLLEKIRLKDSKIRLIGFKAEYEVKEQTLIKEAMDLLKKYDLEFVVANDVSKKIFGEDETEFFIVSGNKQTKIGRISKADAANKIIEIICEKN